MYFSYLYSFFLKKQVRTFSEIDICCVVTFGIVCFLKRLFRLISFHFLLATVIFSFNAIYRIVQLVSLKTTK